MAPRKTQPFKFVTRAGCKAYCRDNKCEKIKNYHICQETQDGFTFTDYRKSQCQPKVPAFHGRTYGFIVRSECMELQERTLARNKALFTVIICLLGMLYVYLAFRLIRTCKSSVRSRNSR